MSDTTNKEELLQLRYELKAIEKQLEKIDEALKKHDAAFYDPDKGIYRRVTGVSESTDEHYKMLKALERKVQNKHETFEQRLQVLETTAKVVHEIGGDNLGNLRTTVEKRKTIDKLTWGAATAFIGGALKLLWDFVSTFL